jgi:hydrogenase maturation factor HypE
LHADVNTLQLLPLIVNIHTVLIVSADDTADHVDKEVKNNVIEVSRYNNFGKKLFKKNFFLLKFSEHGLMSPQRRKVTTVKCYHPALSPWDNGIS